MRLWSTERSDVSRSSAARIAATWFSTRVTSPVVPSGFGTHGKYPCGSTDTTPFPARVTASERYSLRSPLISPSQCSQRTPAWLCFLALPPGLTSHAWTSACPGTLIVMSSTTADAAAGCLCSTFPVRCASAVPAPPATSPATATVTTATNPIRRRPTAHLRQLQDCSYD